MLKRNQILLTLHSKTERDYVEKAVIRAIVRFRKGNGYVTAVDPKDPSKGNKFVSV